MQWPSKGKCPDCGYDICTEDGVCWDCETNQLRNDNAALRELAKRAVEILKRDNAFICNDCGGGDGDHWDDCKTAALLADAEKLGVV